jgi:hypothetical protein
MERNCIGDINSKVFVFKDIIDSSIKLVFSGVTHTLAFIKQCFYEQAAFNMLNVLFPFSNYLKHSVKANAVGEIYIFFKMFINLSSRVNYHLYYE